jgi:hypothetical protein
MGRKFVAYTESGGARQPVDVMVNDHRTMSRPTIGSKFRIACGTMEIPDSLSIEKKMESMETSGR